MSLTQPFTKLRRPPLEIVIKVFKLDTDEEIRSHVINYNDTRRRVWLQKLCVWAWLNGCSVEMYNTGDKGLAETPLPQ